MSEHNVRELLAKIGVDDFTATMLIPTMFMGPAQTDPGMTQVKILTRQLQAVMKTMGATWIVANGYIGQETAYLLHALAGPAWNEHSWAELVELLIAARAQGKQFQRTYGIGAQAVELSGLGLLPELPGKPILIAIGAFLVYRHFTKRR